MEYYVLVWLAFIWIVKATRDLPIIGDDYTIMCYFRDGNVSVSWTHGNVQVAYGYCDITRNPCHFVGFSSTKYKLTIDDRSTSLTIINLTSLDNGIYTCNMFTAQGTLSSDMTLTVLNPVPAYAITLADSLNQKMEYPDNPSVWMTAGQQRDITCTVLGARPPALTEWRTDIERIQFEDQINVVKGITYVSRRVATITPSKDDHNKVIRCLASQIKLPNVLQSTISLFIQVLPRELQLTSQTITNQTGTNTLIVLENVPVIITCRYFGSRPSVALSWELGPTALSGGITYTSRPNSMDNTLSDGESTLRITLQRSDHFKFVRCLTSAEEWQIHEQVRLVVYGPPDAPEILDTTDLQDGMAASVTCIADNGYPAPVFHWHLGNTDLTNESRTEENTNDNHRFMARNVLTFTPRKKDHGRYLVCRVIHSETTGGWSRSVRIMINVTYPPTIVDLSVRRTSDDDGNIAVLFSCQVDARLKAYSIHWFFNGSRLDNASDVMINQFDRPGRETLRTSTLMITNPKEFNEGEYVCEAMTPLGNDSDAIIFNLSIPDPPSRLIVDQNQTISSTLFVAWQPGFHGGFNQTFNLEYCPNDTMAKKEECDVITNLTKPSFRLDRLKAFTWYRLTLWAENSAGNSSTVNATASTAPLQPKNYGVSITWVEKGQVLQISKANQSLDELCFVLKNSKESCPLQNETKCFDPEKEIRIDTEKEISIDPDDDVVVVTYGRGLCSEPANITDQPTQEVPSNNRGTPDMIIAIGVIASISVIIVISLGLMYFYGLMCCTKRKKENGDQQEGRTVDEDGLVYISVAHDRTHPPNAPPIQTEEPTIYASLNKDATKHRKGEMEYSDTKATTPDGQPMYGNYLVKQRKQEQARMPPPVQADDASYRADGSRRSEGAIGPTMPDGQPMYGNYLVKMRKEQERAEQERAEQMAGTYNFFEMYSI